MMIDFYKSDPKEALVDAAMEKYYRLFVKDWAERHQLNQTAREELQEMLKDAFFFVESLAENTDDDEDINELIEPDYDVVEF